MPNNNVTDPNTFIGWLKQLGIAALYALLLYIDELFFESDTIVGHFDSASGLALAALLVGGRRYIWSVLLGAILFNTIFAHSFREAIFIASGDTLQAFCGTWLLARNGKFDLRLQSLRDYMRLILLGGCASVAIGALAVSTALLVSGLLTAGNYSYYLLKWWMGGTLGVILIAPFVMVWWRLKNDWRETGQMAEAVLLSGLTILVGQIVFLDWLHDSIGQVAKGYWMFLLITWVAVRLGTRGTAIALAIVAVQALSGAVRGTGFFANDIAATHLANYWFYMAALSMVGMALATHFTERKQAEDALRESEELLRSITDNASTVIFLKDVAGRYLHVNRQYEKLFHVPNATVQGKTDHDIFPRDMADAFIRNDQMVIQSGQPLEVEECIPHDDGIHTYISVRFPLRNASGGIYAVCGIATDITEHKRAKEEIENLAFYDPLTHLPNRQLLLDRLKQALASSARSGREGALLFIELDNFKTLNDTLGHDIGDLLLQQVAQRLESCIREGDTVARLSGDEFVVMLEDLSERDLEAAAQAEAIGEKILATINQPYQLAAHEHHTTTSIGVTLFCDHDQDQDELLKQADIAMYQAKKAGRNTLRFFDPAMQDTINALVTLESDLRRAVSAQEQFLLHYQAQVDSSGRWIGAEALVRWQHPKRGMVSPAEFIPLAEESGLILPLGHWVLATACRQLAAWAAQPEAAHLTVAVNISAKQFHLPTFVEEVLTLVDHFGVNPAKLKLEITESLMVENVDEIIIKMASLKARGISFSIDDFGTGYSSLQYLKRLPLDQLKIDQSFVHDIADDDNDKAIVRTIIAMAQSMNLNVIAEGVETETQRQLLLNKGCTAYQGYLFGKPAPIEQFEALLKQG